MKETLETTTRSIRSPSEQSSAEGGKDSISTIERSLSPLAVASTNSGTVEKSPIISNEEVNIKLQLWELTISTCFIIRRMC